MSPSGKKTVGSEGGHSGNGKMANLYSTTRFDLSERLFEQQQLAYNKSHNPKLAVGEHLKTQNRH